MFFAYKILPQFPLGCKFYIAFFAINSFSLFSLEVKFVRSDLLDKIIK